MRVLMARKSVGVLIGVIVLFGSAAVVRATQTLSATADPHGKARAATAQIDGPSNLRCITANGEAGQKASCQVIAPGFSGEVEVGKVVALDKAGTVTLTCNGNPPLRCMAEITP
jgi:hypothetical protein